MAGPFSTIGDMACHPFASLRAGSERSEGSGESDEEILRCAQDDRQDLHRMVAAPLHPPKRSFAALRMTGRTLVRSSIMYLDAMSDAAVKPASALLIRD